MKRKRKLTSARDTVKSRRPDTENFGLRKLNSSRFSTHPLPGRFYRVASRDVLPQLTFAGRKLDQKAELALHGIHNLVITGKRGYCVSDPRSTHDKGSRLRVAVWDAIVAAGLAEHCLGSEDSRMVTRYGATKKLMQQFGSWRIKDLVDQNLKPNTSRKTPSSHAPIVLKSGKRDLITDKKLPKEKQNQVLKFPNNPGQVRYIKEQEDHIEFINRSNCSHTWNTHRIDADTGKKRIVPLNACLRQVWTGKLGRGGRLYGETALSIQNLPKILRKRILIDGEPAAEFDFCGLHIRMLYDFEDAGRGNKPPKRPQGDLYKPERIFPRFYHSKDRKDDRKSDIVRGLVKLATNACFNVTSRSRAIQAVRNGLRKSDHREFLYRVIYKVERIEPEEIITRIQKAHLPLARHFFTRIGVESLQPIDGEIMLRILKRFANAGKPAHGIHDSIICKASDADFAQQTMSKVYELFLETLPEISRVY